jgi:hypothetical protein
VEEPRVEQAEDNVQHSFQQPPESIAIETSPAALEKSPGMAILPRVKQTTVIPREKTSVVTKQLNNVKIARTTATKGPSTRSKYAQALTNFVNRRRTGCYFLTTEKRSMVQAIVNYGPRAAAEFANEICNDESGKLFKYRSLITHPKYCKTWMHSSANEFGRLVQGVGNRIKGTDTIFFVHKHEVPQD